MYVCIYIFIYILFMYISITLSVKMSVFAHSRGIRLLISEIDSQYLNIHIDRMILQ